MVCPVSYCAPFLTIFLREGALYQCACVCGDLHASNWSWTVRQRGLCVCGAGKLESAECVRIAWVPTSESQAGVAIESDEWLGCQVSMRPDTGETRGLTSQLLDRPRGPDGCASVSRIRRGSVLAAAGELRASRFCVRVAASVKTGHPGASYWIDWESKAGCRRDPCWVCAYISNSKPSFLLMSWRRMRLFVPFVFECWVFLPVCHLLRVCVASVCVCLLGTHAWPHYCF